MSKVKATYHIVFGTKNRMQTITPEHRKNFTPIYSEYLKHTNAMCIE